MQTTLPLDGRTAAIGLLPGPQATERYLLDEIAGEIRDDALDSGRLGRPVRVVVPSTSLRLHLNAAIVRHFGRSVLGVQVQTLHSVVIEILGRVGYAMSSHVWPFELWIRREAAKEPALAKAMEEFGDGFAAVSASIRDLFDAGFHSAHLESLRDRAEGFDSEGVDIGTRDRFAGLLRVAAKVCDHLPRTEAMQPASAMLKAAEILEEKGDSVLPSRRVLIHGFSDATGVAMDLVEALLRSPGALILVDHPPGLKAGALTGDTPGFTRDLLNRLHKITLPELYPTEVCAAQISLLRAPGVDGEIYAVARRLRDLIDRGVAPERIGVVARDPAPYLAPLRRYFRRFGLPFSGVGLHAPIGVQQGRAFALVDLIRRGERAPVARWLACRADFGSAESSRNRAALRAMGVGRVQDIRGLHPGAAASEPGLTEVLSEIQSLLGKLRSFPGSAPFEVFLAWLEHLNIEHLGWEPSAQDEGGWLDGLRQLAPGLSSLGDISGAEFLLLLDGAAREMGRRPVGGMGGGLQFLDVMEARARTFEYLFILGMNRGVFPRVIHQDPLLPEGLRMRLRSVLPDIPLKNKGFDEEPYLFAQLLASAPDVTLSWQSVDAKGKAMAPSSFVDGLIIDQPGLLIEDVAAPMSDLDLGADCRQRDIPAMDHALRHALSWRRDRLAPRLALAMQAAHSAAPTSDMEAHFAAAAQSRLAVLAEQDPDWRNQEEKNRFSDLGPYLGLLGDWARGGVEREERLFVTTLERFSGCPWQTFVERLLRVRPVEDPLCTIPGLDRRILGNVVHDVLGDIASGQGAPSHQELFTGGTAAPVSVRWPERADLEGMVRREAARQLGGVFPGFPELGELFTAQALTYLEQARTLDWPLPSDKVAMVGTEMKGQSAVTDADGAMRQIHFRVDRVHREGEGLVFVDYKTGKVFSAAKAETTRRQHFLAAMGRGAMLQAMAYARSASGGGVEGRYLFLGPKVDESARSWSVDAEDGEMRQVYEGVMKVLLRGWDKGAFFPRLVEPGTDKEPSRCGYCAVAEACVRGDSGARGRMVRWEAEMRARMADGVALDDGTQSIFDLWRLGTKEKGGVR